MMKKVAIQGYRASFHDVAARKLMGDDIEIVPCDTFVGVFKAVMNGKADAGVVAISNTIYGPIAESQHLFKLYNVMERGEISIPVELCLLGYGGVPLSSIAQIYSHPVALAQCKPFIVRNLPQAEPCGHVDTAGAAADVAKWHDPYKAAIASRAAGELYGLQVLASNIQDAKDNQTKFVWFEKS